MGRLSTLAVAVFGLCRSVVLVGSVLVYHGLGKSG